METDDEIEAVCADVPYGLAEENIGEYDRRIARAVIAADRYKNK